MRPLAARRRQEPYEVEPVQAVHVVGKDLVYLFVIQLGKVGRYSSDIIAEAMFLLTEIRNGKANDRKGPGRTPERNR